MGVDTADAADEEVVVGDLFAMLKITDLGGMVNRVMSVNVLLHAWK